MITPSSIYAPGSLIRPPGYGGGPPGGAQDGYGGVPGGGVDPGYGSAPGYGASAGYAAGPPDAASKYSPGPSYGADPYRGTPDNGGGPGYVADPGYSGGNGYPAGPGYGTGPGYGAPPGHPTGPGYGASLPPYPEGPGYAAYDSSPGHVGGPPHPGSGAYRPEQPAAPGYGNPSYGYSAEPGYGAAANGYIPAAHAGAAPNGYAGPDGYGETVNGGYAYVIREDEEFAPHPPRQGTPEPDRRSDQQSRMHQQPHPGRQPRQDQQLPQDDQRSQNHQAPQDYQRAQDQQVRRAQQVRPEPPRMDPLADSDPSTFVYRDVGAGDESDEPEIAEPGLPYGPDDPAYGPPTPDWHTRREEEEARQQAAAEELRHVRGPFEPLPYSPGASQAAAGDWAASALYEPAPDEDDGFGSPADRTLEHIKDLYLTAEAIGAENLDKHFQQLLERQRQLISEYFKEFDLRASAEASGSNRGDGPNGSGDGPNGSDNEHSAVGLEGGSGVGSGHVTSASDRRSPR